MGKQDTHQSTYSCIHTTNQLVKVHMYLNIVICLFSFISGVYGLSYSNDPEASTYIFGIFVGLFLIVTCIMLLPKALTQFFCFLLKLNEIIILQSFHFSLFVSLFMSFQLCHPRYQPNSSNIEFNR